MKNVAKRRHTARHKATADERRWTPIVDGSIRVHRRSSAVSFLTGSSFPGLATALNPEEMLDLLRNVLADGHRHLQVKEAKIMDVKFEPGKEGTVLYRFKISDQLTKINHKQLFTASLMKENDEPPQEFGWENVMRYPRSENLLVDKPFFYLSGPKILLCAFPYDPSIPWLGNLLDEQFLKERLNLIWGSKDVVVQEVKTDLLGYTPRLRGVFLHRMKLEERTTGVERRSEFIGKTSSYKVPEVLFADQWALWKSCRDRVGIPQPEGYLSNPRLTLQERVAGERLGTLVKTPSFNELLRQTANSIAVIHSTRIPLHKMRDPVRETQSLRRWGVVLQNIRSDLAQRIQILHESLLGEMERRTTVSATVHGDFHPANVLVAGNKIWLIDFDQMANGDPSADVGRFLASLRILSLRNFGDISSLKGSGELFLEEYLKSGCGNPSSIRMFESSSLLTTAGSAFRVQRAGWEKEVFLLLEEAERVFEKSRSRTS